MLFLRHGDVISNLFPVKTADEVFKHQTSNPEMTQNQWASENLTWNAKPEATMPRSASTKNRRYMQLYSILWKIVLQQNASRSRIYNIKIYLESASELFGITTRTLQTVHVSNFQTGNPTPRNMQLWLDKEMEFGHPELITDFYAWNAGNNFAIDMTINLQTACTLCHAVMIHDLSWSMILLIRPVSHKTYG